MHDANGKELIIGDIILVPMKIIELSPTEDYCNITAESIYARRPDNSLERFSAFNTAVCLRSRANDDAATVVAWLATKENPAG